LTCGHELRNGDTGKGERLTGAALSNGQASIENVPVCLLVTYTKQQVAGVRWASLSITIVPMMTEKLTTARHESSSPVFISGLCLSGSERDYDRRS
jgi:hypothetical protein